MKVLIHALLLLITTPALADWKLIEPREVSVGYRDFFPGGYDTLISESGLGPRDLGKEVTLTLNSDFLKYGYFNNLVHTRTDEVPGTGGKGQFRTVGWNFKLGVHLSQYLDFEYEHHSQHMLDVMRPGRFPVEDSLGIKLYFYRDQRPSHTVLP